MLQALGTIRIQFLQKSVKKISCLCTFNTYLSVGKCIGVVDLKPALPWKAENIKIIAGTPLSVFSRGLTVKNIIMTNGLNCSRVYCTVLVQYLGQVVVRMSLHTVSLGKYSIRSLKGLSLENRWAWKWYLWTLASLDEYLHVGIADGRTNFKSYLCLLFQFKFSQRYCKNSEWKLSKGKLIYFATAVNVTWALLADFQKGKSVLRTFFPISENFFEYTLVHSSPHLPLYCTGRWVRLQCFF